MRRIQFNGSILALLALLLSAGCQSEGPQAPDKETRKSFMLASQASMARAGGDLKLALTLADSSLDVSITDHGLAAKAGVLSDLLQFDAANRVYGKLVDRNPVFPAAQFNMGNNDFLQGAYHDAVEHYQRELTLQANPPSEVFQQLGRAWSLLGNSSEASENYQRAMAANPLNAQVLTWFSELLEADGDVQEALEHAGKAHEIEPGNPLHQIRLGQLLLTSGEPQRALPFLESAVAASPSDETATYALGRAYVMTGARDKGEQLLTRVDSLQSLRFRIGRLRSEAALRPEDPGRWRVLVDALTQAGRHAEAEQSMRILNYLEGE